MLAVLPTGGGKSICYQIPSLMLDGLTLVVSPLIALMQDQVDALQARGIPAATLHSGLSVRSQRRVLGQASAGALRLLYLSPERLRSLLQGAPSEWLRPTLLAIDEAHCISEWGPDFRPSFRGLGRLRMLLGWPQVIALTGSATPTVRRDIMEVLRMGRGTPSRRVVSRVFSFDRPNLVFGVRQVQDDEDRFRWLTKTLGTGDQVVLIYAPTRGVTESLARHLKRSGRLAAAYHAGLPADLRASRLNAFLEDRIETLVATCAFGMGIDKPNVRTVIHWRMPPSPESYYQEAGRAGRDQDTARCTLLYHPDDVRQARRLLEVTFPSPRLVEAIAADPARRRGVPHNVLDSVDRLIRELRLPRRAPDWGRVKKRKQQAIRRIQAMQHYAEAGGCRRRMLLAWFGETLDRCAGCDRCRASACQKVVLPTPDTVVVSELSRWRRITAQRLGQSETEIIPDLVLANILLARPTTRTALAKIPGVGPRGLARFGPQVLALFGGAKVEGALSTD